MGEIRDRFDQSNFQRSEGMKLAREKGYKNVIIESDSKKVVEWVTREDNRKKIRDPIKNIIDKCKDMMKRDWEVRIYCVYREQNRTADCLARQALNHKRGLRVYDQAPSDMKVYLQQDMKGAPIARRVII